MYNKLYNFSLHIFWLCKKNCVFGKSNQYTVFYYKKDVPNYVNSYIYIKLNVNFLTVMLT